MITFIITVPIITAVCILILVPRCRFDLGLRRVFRNGCSNNGSWSVHVFIFVCSSFLFSSSEFDDCSWFVVILTTVAKRADTCDVSFVHIWAISTCSLAVNVEIYLHARGSDLVSFHTSGVESNECWRLVWDSLSEASFPLAWQVEENFGCHIISSWEHAGVLVKTVQLVRHISHTVLKKILFL